MDLDLFHWFAAYWIGSSSTTLCIFIVAGASLLIYNRNHSGAIKALLWPSIPEDTTHKKIKSISNVILDLILLLCFFLLETTVNYIVFNGFHYIFEYGFIFASIYLITIVSVLLMYILCLTGGRQRKVVALFHMLSIFLTFVLCATMSIPVKGKPKDSFDKTLQINFGNNWENFNIIYLFITLLELLVSLYAFYDFIFPSKNNTQEFWFFNTWPFAVVNIFFNLCVIDYCLHPRDTLQSQMTILFTFLTVTYLIQICKDRIFENDNVRIVSGSLRKLGFGI
ncbi:hypothetical protein [Bifidobacterium sp. ESL0732]|uniref:hypothetical protein n=1 Tax=Bifidobacterium sp. ESL0732 TaxID=2983222 RepID=UPI0023F657C3|nr:hypothetical protein [Bifidobacterium sp. ESL0732]WEV64540.1 hypothetical protein OZX70_02885 [Bifidobacterium sp. ESL0732]